MTRPSVRCPEFPPDLTWINTRRPLTVREDLQGRVAILDFWTYCCINCMHVLPVLHRIQARFSQEPVIVIGVHSAKFLSEREPANIRRAVGRHGVMHPVVVDSDHDIWQRFSVHAWPTVILVDAAGYVRESLSGEVEEDLLGAKVRMLLDEGKEQGILGPGPIDVAPESEAEPSFLRFPGRIHVAGDLLYIADSGHNRIVVADPQGRTRHVIGEGGVGAHDGPASEASFQNPQGMAVSGSTLYIADTGNHLLRSADLSTLEVKTLAGTGEKGSGSGSLDPREPRRIALRSPWGLLAVGSQILIAMAGSHQIWVYDSQRGFLGPWAGSGREDHIDGSRSEAAFAQPSGLAQAGKFVLVADSEISSVRAIDLLEGRVRTVVGRGLFDFGDREGSPEQVLLQHPLDLAVEANVLYVADTYNNKIKAISFGTMETRTVLGDGQPSTMHEPGGIALLRGKLLIADTNNHRILRGDPQTGDLDELVLSS